MLMQVAVMLTFSQQVTKLVQVINTCTVCLNVMILANSFNVQINFRDFLTICASLDVSSGFSLSLETHLDISSSSSLTINSAIAKQII